MGTSEHDHLPRDEGKSELTEPFAADALDPYYLGRLEVLKDGLGAHSSDSLRVPVGATPESWPQLLHNAVGQVCPNGEYTDTEYLTRFERRYGPCSMARLVALARRYAALHVNPALVTSAEEGVVDVDDEILFVLLMLGAWPEHPQANLARGILGEFLASPELIERIQSAISLGHLRDERAIPPLLMLLTDALPQVEQDGRPHDTRDRAWWKWNLAAFVPFQATVLFRREIPWILARWGVRSAVPALRQTLMLMVDFERTHMYRNPEWSLWIQDWWMYQSDLVGALARLGAFGALVGIEPLEAEGAGHEAAQTVSESKVGASRADKGNIVYRWRVTMCRAVVSQQYEEAGRHGIISATEVRSEVKRLLAEFFGLDAEECRAALEPYMDQHLRLELA